MRPAAGRSTSPRRSESRQLAQRAEQREVERGAHRLRSQAPREIAVGGELRPVARELLIEKLIEPAALVRARLVVDHPARPALVDEASVDDDAAQQPAGEARELPLAVRLAVPAVEDPAPALVAEGPRERGDYARARLRALALGDTGAGELGEYRPALIGDAPGRWQPRGLRQPRKPGMHHGPHMARRLADPAELGGLGGEVGSRQSLHGYRQRRLGGTPARQEPQ